MLSFLEMLARNRNGVDGLAPFAVGGLPFDEMLSSEVFALSQKLVESLLDLFLFFHVLLLNLSQFILRKINTFTKDRS